MEVVPHPNAAEYMNFVTFRQRGIVAIVTAFAEWVECDE
jgi:hypothetical protein